MKSVILIVLILSFSTILLAQSVVSGVVINKETGEPIDGAAITSYYFHTGVFTDYKGRYTLTTDSEDTLKISILGYESQNISIHGGWHTSHQVNVSLEVSLITLHDLTITQQKIYRADSVQNREDNKSIFNYKSPRALTSFLHIPFITPSYGGIQFGTGLGFNIESAYERYLNKHYRRIKHFQQILIIKEKEDYVKNYFNPATVSEITGLKGAELQKFLKSYQPEYSSLVGKSTYDIDKLIKDSFAKYHALQQ